MGARIFIALALVFELGDVACASTGPMRADGRPMCVVSTSEHRDAETVSVDGNSAYASHEYVFVHELASMEADGTIYARGSKERRVAVFEDGRLAILDIIRPIVSAPIANGRIVFDTAEADIVLTYSETCSIREAALGASGVMLLIIEHELQPRRGSRRAEPPQEIAPW